MSFTPAPGIPQEDTVQELESRNKKLDAKNKALERKLKIINTELYQLREEMKALATMPLQVGTVVDVSKDHNNDSNVGIALVMIRGSNQVFRVGYAKVKQSGEKLNLQPGTMVVLHPKTLAIVDTLPESEDTYVRAMEVIRKPDITFEMIGGLSEEIKLIVEAIELSLTQPELFEEIGIDPPKGVLLYGPPGTGKTMIAKALAHESNVTFIRLAAPELAQKFIGDGARLVREIFQFARKNSPAIIFIDEIDAIAMRRSDLPTEGNTEIHRTFLQLLAELDGFNERGNIKFIAATNRPDVLDKAITRPGRFDRKIEIPLPNDEGRIEIFKVHTRKMKLGDIDYHTISQLTEGFNGSEIKAVCTEAGLEAIRNRKRCIEMSNFVSAIDKVVKKAKTDFFTQDYA